MDFIHTSCETIVPSPPCTPHLVTLSNNDLIMPPYYTGFLYFFHAPTEPEHLVRPKSLKLALARALAAFPPAAGRLKARSNGAGMDVECNNQGAVFVEAHATAMLKDLLISGNSSVRGRDTFQPSPLWKSLAPDPSAIDQGPAEKPLLFTQLTRLACGGVVLAVKLHHFVGDGAAQDYFVSSWAELARNGEISTHPHLDRAVMKARTPLCPSFEHIEYIVHKEVPSGYSSTTKPPPMTSKIFEFRTEDILLLKDRANSHVKKDALTGFQALASYIWKHVTKARGIEPSCNIKLGWAVDGRKRFNPPLPTNYFGNVNFYGCVESKAGEVVAKPLDCAATSIRSATNCITDEYMHSALDFIESQMNPFLLTASFVGTADLAMTSWTRFASYEVDFGWGKPVWFAPPIYDFAGLVILLPHPTDQGGANILIGMLEVHMKALLTDAEFYPVR